MSDTTSERGTFFRSVHAAFSSWGTVLGIVAASVTGFNLLRKLLDIGVAQVIADLLHIYQNWVHVPVRWLFELLHWPEPSAWAIDIGLLWLLISGIVLRSAWSMRSSLGRYGANVSKGWISGVLRRSALFVVIFCLLVWPLALIGMLQSPIIKAWHTERDSGGGIWLNTRRPPNLVFDFRIVLVAQALAALACIGAWIISNGLLQFYS